jgi:hypothetical protein
MIVVLMLLLMIPAALMASLIDITVGASATSLFGIQNAYSGIRS